MINVWEYAAEFALEKQEIYEAIDTVFSSGRLILGPQTEAFEEKFAKWCGANFSVGVGNGTDAIFLACKALGLQSGDEVITVANTAVPTVSAIVAAGGVPVFVDVNPDTYLMDINLVEKKISAKTKLIIPVHLYGQMVDMDPLMALAGKYKIQVIEDCAQAHGAKYKGRTAGTIGDVAAFSFYPTKILGAYGDAGLCLTSNEVVRDKLRRLRFYGMEKNYYSIEHGYNSRIDELQAAILLKKLEHLTSYIKARQKIARIYDHGLRGTSFILPQSAPQNEHAYYLYVLRHSRRDEVIRLLSEKLINVNISYPWPIHTMKAFDHLQYKLGDLPHTELVAAEIFSLPMYPQLEESQQFRVMDVLREIDHQLS
ncbi:daunorubicin biosynthesis sensory transduction protein DnrJ [Polynucleobacter tropicus]|uniref:Daunorubicin biosynthesis sensory transduction protein DnrJ n=1 Tax=Polynucleobacter tropicus TaxID=1743174 RepID=A0A6M9PNX4_9BURK|nr:DegT/DnrJ/EryC1/StrS family aminotransferase [Polynucleobacter tropicus]QKM64054.1 daunorubicin biosynthesis sensory transduction protein DnrJ [Polynucleobacter tropicus]